MDSLYSSAAAFNKGTSFPFNQDNVPSFKYPPLSYSDYMKPLMELHLVLFRNIHTFSAESLMKQCDYLLQISQSSPQIEGVVDALLDTVLFLRATASKLPESPHRDAKRSNLLNAARTIAILLAEHGSSYYGISNENQLKEASIYIDWMNESGVMFDSEKAKLKECLKIAHQKNPDRKLATAYYNQFNQLDSGEFIADEIYFLYKDRFNADLIP